MDDKDDDSLFNPSRSNNTLHSCADDIIDNIQMDFMEVQEESGESLPVLRQPLSDDSHDLGSSIQFEQDPMSAEVLFHQTTLKYLPELTINIIKKKPIDDSVLQSLPQTTQKTREPSPEPFETGDMRGEALIRFRVQDVVHLDERNKLSQPVYIRNLPWRILVMAKTTSGQSFSSSSNDYRHAEHLGFFLQCDGGDLPNWSIFAASELRLLSFNDDEPYAKRIRHNFNAKANDWGFQNFIDFESLLKPEYTKDGAIELEAKVVADVPNGICWNSRLFAGYVGIENQGATCYMNSLLQTLFFTNELRRAVFRIPTEADDSNRSVALGLQGVFYDLQFSACVVATKKLTKSFGWNSVDSFTQHDVQEFLRVLLDKLESRMKGSSLEGTVPRLFGGQMTSYVKCINVEYKSMRSEMFYDIQLNIRGQKNVSESLKDYVAIELLDGDNTYDAGDLGMQDAEKGVIFTSFPPVLHLHLMRFEYDASLDACAKSNDRFEFSEHLSLGEFLQATNEGGLMAPEDAEYTLQAVLVHSGDNQAGHYIAYIDPKADGNWFKFDDDRVCATSKVEAIEYNFGGYRLDDIHLYIKTSNSNAYMLVYIQNSEIPTVLKEVLESEIPQEMVNKLMDERKIESENINEKAREKLYMAVRIRLEEHFDTENAQKLFEESKATDLVFYLKRNQTVHDLVEILSTAFRTPPARMRFWPIRHRRFHQSRPSAFDHNTRLTELIGTASDHDPWTIFLELVPADEALDLQVFNNTENAQLFFKYYDPALSRMSYCGLRYMSLGLTVNEMMPILCELAGLPADTALTFYEETHPNEVQRVLNYDDSIEKSLALIHNLDAAVVIFEKANQTAMDYELPTFSEFLEDFNKRIDITFVDKSISNDSGFQLVMSEHTLYPKMVSLVANHLKIAVERLQFFKCNKYTHDNEKIQWIPVKSDYNGIVIGLLAYSRGRFYRRLFYRRLEMDLKDFENRKHVIVNWLPIDGKEVKKFSVYPLRCGTLRSILVEMESKIQLDPVKGSGKLRLVEISECRIMAATNLDEPIDNLKENDLSTTATNSNQYRVEEIPKDQATLLADEMLVAVMHYDKDLERFFGHPFYLKVKDGERWYDIMQRIYQKCCVPEINFDQHKILMIKGADMEYVSHDFEESIMRLTNLQEEEIAGDLVQPYLAIEYLKQNHQQKRSRLSTSLSNSVIIYN